MEQDKKQVESTKEYTSVSKWVWIHLFVGIPVLNWILLLHYGLSKKSRDLKNYAISLLIVKMVSTTISIVLCIYIGMVINSNIEQLRALAERFLG